MTKALKKLPHYIAGLAKDTDGILRVSLVDRPAVESGFIAYAAQGEVKSYRVADETKHRVFGVILRADFPIYRRDYELGEYYITFKADAIREFAQKFLAESRQNRVDLAHDMWEIRGAEMVQIFLKNSGDGVSPAGFEDIADGSLFAEYQITDDALWKRIVSGEFKGFSVEIMHEIIPDNYHNHNMSVMNKIKEAIAQGVKASVKYGSVATNGGALMWEGDEDLTAGREVWQLDESGNRKEAADGEYVTDDQKVIVVVDGKVAEIKDAEAEVAPQGEGMEEVPAEVAERDARIAELEARNAELESEVAERDARIAELEAKLKEPAVPQGQFNHTAQDIERKEQSYLDRILNAGK